MRVLLSHSRGNCKSTTTTILYTTKKKNNKHSRWENKRIFVASHFFRCSCTELGLELELGAGSTNICETRPTMRATPIQSPHSTAASTSSNNTAPSIYRGANTFQTIRCLRSHAALSALPSSNAPKYSEVPSAARTAASTAMRA